MPNLGDDYPRPALGCMYTQEDVDAVVKAAVDKCNEEQSALVAAALREAAGKIDRTAFIDSEGDWIVSLDEVRDMILALISQPVQSALDRALLRARIEEAEWWEHLAEESHSWHEENKEHPCPYCVHIDDLERRLKEMEGGVDG